MRRLNKSLWSWVAFHKCTLRWQPPCAQCPRAIGYIHHMTLCTVKSTTSAHGPEWPLNINQAIPFHPGVSLRLLIFKVLEKLPQPKWKGIWGSSQAWPKQFPSRRLKDGYTLLGVLSIAYTLKTKSLSCILLGKTLMHIENKVGHECHLPCW